MEEREDLQQEVQSEVQGGQGKERSAKVYVKKAQTAVRIIKALVIAAGVLAGILLVYGILAVTVMKDTQGALIGFIVILSLVGVIFIALIAMFIYAKINLGKLKKLN